MNHSPYLERVMMGAGGSVDALAWFNRRLFSVGLLGSVIEYDLFSQSAKVFVLEKKSVCILKLLHKLHISKILSIPRQKSNGFLYMEKVLYRLLFNS